VENLLRIDCEHDQPTARLYAVPFQDRLPVEAAAQMGVLQNQLGETNGRI